MSDKIKDITDEVEEIETEEEVEQEEEKTIEVKGGIMMLRTKEGRIVYETIDEVGWEDITMFSEYLERLKNQLWDERLAFDIDED